MGTVSLYVVPSLAAAEIVPPTGPIVAARAFAVSVPTFERPKSGTELIGEGSAVALEVGVPVGAGDDVAAGTPAHAHRARHAQIAGETIARDRRMARKYRDRRTPGKTPTAAQHDDHDGEGSDDEPQGNRDNQALGRRRRT